MSYFIDNQVDSATNLQKAVLETITPLLTGEITKAEASLAKKEITATQKEIRLHKANITDRQRLARQEFQEQNVTISGTGQTVGLLFGSKGRTAMAKGRQAARRNLQREKIAAMAEYDRAKATIDRLLLGLDRAKTEIDRHLASAAVASEQLV